MRFQSPDKLRRIATGRAPDKDIIGIAVLRDRETREVGFLGIKEKSERFTISGFLNHGITVLRHRLFPFKGFDHADDIGAKVFVHGRQGIGVRSAVTIDRGPKEMARRVGHEELAGRSRISFEVKEHAIDARLGMGIILLGDGCCERGIAIDELKGIVSQFPQVIAHRFVRTMDGGIEGGIDDVDPIGFAGL